MKTVLELPERVKPTKVSVNLAGRGSTRKRRAQQALLVFFLPITVAVYAASTEVGAGLALATMRLPNNHAKAHDRESAIVLLTGSHVGRIPKAAELQRATGLPLIVAGRNAGHYFNILQRAGAQSLWSESYSINTEQNAAYSACLATRKNIRSVFVVTDEAHMPRALAWFRYYGLEVTPVVSGPPWPGSSTYPLLPSKLGWARTKAVVHEWFGLIDFGLRWLFEYRLACPTSA